MYIEAFKGDPLVGLAALKKKTEERSVVEVCVTPCSAGELCCNANLWT